MHQNDPCAQFSGASQAPRDRTDPSSLCRPCSRVRPPCRASVGLPPRGWSARPAHLGHPCARVARPPLCPRLVLSFLIASPRKPPASLAPAFSSCCLSFKPRRRDAVPVPTPGGHRRPQSLFTVFRSRTGLAAAHAVWLPHDPGPRRGPLRGPGRGGRGHGGGGSRPGGRCSPRRTVSVPALGRAAR